MSTQSTVSPRETAALDSLMEKVIPGIFPTERQHLRALLALAYNHEKVAGAEEIRDEVMKAFERPQVKS